MKLSLADLATDVLGAVEQEQLANSQKIDYTKEASVSTDLGKQMVKLAEVLRAEKNEITYADLAEFRARYGL